MAGHLPEWLEREQVLRWPPGPGALVEAAWSVVPRWRFPRCRILSRWSNLNPGAQAVCWARPAWVWLVSRWQVPVPVQLMVELKWTAELAADLR